MNNSQAIDTKQKIIDELLALRTFVGPPSQFWPLFFEKVSQLFSAQQSVLLIKKDSEQDWRELLSWPNKAPEKTSVTTRRRTKESANTALLSETSSLIHDAKQKLIFFSAYFPLGDQQASTVVSVIVNASKARAF
ncbi:hypothetical protein N9Y67_04570 [Pseudomonadota bacterium]|nr:hypothetical protein [Pseudomonadota bacterium]